MKNQSRILVLSGLVTLFSGAEEFPPNPFVSISPESGGGAAAAYENGVDDRSDIHPLQRAPLSQLTVMGVLVSAKGRAAMVRTSNNEEFFVHLDDFLGNAGGRISEITERGLEVKEEEEVTLLSVRNRSAGD